MNLSSVTAKTNGCFNHRVVTLERQVIQVMLVLGYYQQDHGCDTSRKVPYCNFEVCICNDSLTDVLRAISILW